MKGISPLEDFGRDDRRMDPRLHGDDRRGAQDDGEGENDKGEIEGQSMSWFRILNQSGAAVSEPQGEVVGSVRVTSMVYLGL